MTKRTSTWLPAGLGLVLLAGCAQNTITGTGSRQEQVFCGTVGITGDEHEVTILAGSEVPKLSIIGEDNQVFVLNGAVVEKIEIVGDDNEVICPEGMTIEYSEIGEDNRLKRQP